MLRRAFVLLLATLAQAGCGDLYNGGFGGGYQRPIAMTVPPRPGSGPVGDLSRSASRVAILLPLTGNFAEIGQAMQRAARLALPEGEAPVLETLDTGGTPDGAANAARTAIAGGAGLILGPLTSAETAAVAPIARDGGVAVLAFTNDPSQAQPGVWTLGITPAQQVRRLVAAARTQGRTHVAALLPESNLGRVMADALRQAASAMAMQEPTIRMHAAGMGAITSSIRDLSGYASRRGPIDARIKAARARGTPEGRREAAELAKSRVGPAPFDALLLADTGEPLAEIAAVLPYYDIDAGAVQIMGPAQWASSGSGSGNFGGAWYAAPDLAARSAMDASFSAKYGGKPPAIADLAFDAASVARVLSSQGRFSVGALT